MDTWIKEYINYLNNAQLSEAYDLKRNHLPDKIFRYRPVNKHALDNLKTDTTWLCSPREYNDPYDSAFTFDFERINRATVNSLFANVTGFSEEDIETIKSNHDPLGELLILLLRKKLPQTNIPDDFLEQWLAIFKKAVRRYYEKLIESMNRSNHEKLRLCSFSSSRSSIVMWAHYARNHEGFCIEYDLTALNPDDERKRKLFPVIYSDILCDLSHAIEFILQNITATVINDIATVINKGEGLTFDFVDTKELNDYDKIEKIGIGSLLIPLYKSKEWYYEREWRLLNISDSSNTDQNYSMPTPSVIYLGARMSEDDKKLISDIAASKNIDIFQMKLSKFEFKLLEDKAGAGELSPLEQMNYEVEQELIPALRDKMQEMPSVSQVAFSDGTGPSISSS